MIELGGKIFLEGFESLDQAELLVAKKLVGSYVRTACDRSGCERAEILLEKVTGGFRVVARAVGESAEAKEAEATGKNVFMTIDAALKHLLHELNIQ